MDQNPREGVHPADRWGEFFSEFNNEVFKESAKAMTKHKQDYWGRHEFYAILLEEHDDDVRQLCGVVYAPVRD